MEEHEKSHNSFTNVEDYIFILVIANTEKCDIEAIPNPVAINPQWNTVKSSYEKNLNCNIQYELQFVYNAASCESNMKDSNSNCSLRIKKSVQLPNTGTGV